MRRRAAIVGALAALVLAAIAFWPKRTYEECLDWAASKAASDGRIFFALREEVCRPELAKQLARERHYDIAEARKAGYSYSQIIEHLQK